MRPDAPLDLDPSYVHTARGRIAYVDTRPRHHDARSKPIVAIHGAPGTSRDFRWLAAAMPPETRFIALDLPGFGGSSRTDAPRTPSGQAEAVRAFCEALELDAPVICGHSMGGIIATRFAALYPEHVSSVALLSTPGFRRHRGFRFPRRAIASGLAFAPSRALLAPLLRRSFHAAGFSPRFSDDERRLTIDLIAAVSFEENRRAVAKLRCPALVAYGTSDDLIETSISEELARALPRGPRLVMTGEGHNPQKGHAMELAEALKSLAETAGLAFSADPGQMGDL